jgi:hypothetical protein
VFRNDIAADRPAPLVDQARRFELCVFGSQIRLVLGLLCRDRLVLLALLAAPLANSTTSFIRSAWSDVEPGSLSGARLGLAVKFGRLGLEASDRVRDLKVGLGLAVDCHHGGCLHAGSLGVDLRLELAAKVRDTLGGSRRERSWRSWAGAFLIADDLVCGGREIHHRHFLLGCVSDDPLRIVGAEWSQLVNRAIDRLHLPLLHELADTLLEAVRAAISIASRRAS